MRAALLEYWSGQARTPLQQRLLGVDALACGDSLDSRELQAIAVAALADDAVEVVFAATLRYLSLPRRGAELHAAHVDDALQWAGRRLTLRPEAVFAALLTQGDEEIEARLAPIRRVTNSIDVANVLCAAGQLDALCRSEFMSEWRALELTQVEPESPLSASPSVR